MLIGILAGVITFAVSRMLWDAHQAQVKRMQVLQMLCIDASRSMQQIDRVRESFEALAEKLRNDRWTTDLDDVPAYFLLDPTMLSFQHCLDSLNADDTGPILRYFARWKTAEGLLAIYRGQYCAAEKDVTRRPFILREMHTTLLQLSEVLSQLRGHCLDVQRSWCNSEYPLALKSPNIQRDTEGLFSHPEDIDDERKRWEGGRSDRHRALKQLAAPLTGPSPALVPTKSQSE
jgi:hypothetical protein